MAQERVSIREFARRLGCTEAAVRRARKKGYLGNGIEGEGRKVKVLVETARASWAKHHEPEGRQNSVLFQRLHQAEPLTDYPPDIPLSQDIPDKPPVSTAASAPPAARSEAKTAVTEANKVKATFTAATAKLNYEKAAGKLVEKDKVYAAFFTIGQEFKATMMAIPDRYIDEIHAAEDRNTAHSILHNAIAQALEHLSETREIDIE